jgi:hypothetical protein
MVLTAKFLEGPDGALVAAWNGKRLEAPFSIKAEFKGSPGEIANGCYRQSVKGCFEIDGQPVRHRLCRGVFLEPDIYQEDGCPPPFGTAFGYRENAGADTSGGVIDRYSGKAGALNMAKGALYQCFDAPGLSAGIGSELTLDLSYFGQLYDRSTDRELAHLEWNISGTYKIPEKIQAAEESAMPLGRFIDIDLLPDGVGGWSGTLYVSGPDPKDKPGAPILKFTVEDPNGRPLGLFEPEKISISEVGSARNRTRTLEFQILAGQPDPSRLRGFLDDEPFEIDLRFDD